MLDDDMHSIARREVSKYISRRPASESHYEDMVQEAIIKMMAIRRSMASWPGPARYGYLARAIASACADYDRKRRRRLTHPMPDVIEETGGPVKAAWSGRIHTPLEILEGQRMLEQFMDVIAAAASKMSDKQYDAFIERLAPRSVIASESSTHYTHLYRARDKVLEEAKIRRVKWLTKERLGGLLGH